MYHVFCGPYFGSLTDLLLLYAAVGLKECRPEGNSYMVRGYELNGATQFTFSVTEVEIFAV